MSTLLNRTLVILAASAAIWTASCKSEESYLPPPSGTLSESQITTTAVVKRIDYNTRLVTLERPDGTRITSSRAIRSSALNEVKVGSTVVATYTEALAFEVKKAGTDTMGTTVTAGVERNSANQSPGVTGQRTTTVTAKIVGIDISGGFVTLQMPDGDVRTYRARTPDNLKRVAIDDLVDITLKNRSACPSFRPTPEPGGGVRSTPAPPRILRPDRQRSGRVVCTAPAVPPPCEAGGSFHFHRRRRAKESRLRTHHGFVSGSEREVGWLSGSEQALTNVHLALDPRRGSRAAPRRP
jgi:hypothetical protein